MMARVVQNIALFDCRGHNMIFRKKMQIGIKSSFRTKEYLISTVSMNFGFIGATWVKNIFGAFEQRRICHSAVCYPFVWFW